MKQKLDMPVLTLGGQYFAAAFLKDHTKLVANNVFETNIPNSGHWIVQENTTAVQKGLLDFFLERK
jgi:pimeloyl-ACP methyl ester carboxylesterase